MPTLLKVERREWWYASNGGTIEEKQMSAQEDKKIFIMPEKELSSTFSEELLDLSVTKSEIDTYLNFDEKIEEMTILYHFIQEKEVRYFLEENKFLISFLKEAYTQIKRIFGGETDLTLMLTDDPEENFEELIIVVHIRTSVKKVIKLREKLHKEWLFSVIPQLKGKLNILVEVI
ncbi:MAG TPA: hypothetical protein ENI51_11685 [Candidatus Atribacteria bacterium]|nr:hypothetical protein [Candidatus Atribacteria bacterium]